jgi:transcriptional regulator with XRE-family HTH domain
MEDVQAASRPREVFARRVKEVRTRRGWTQQELADRMALFGWPIDRATIARTEGLAREVSLEEALAICVALGVCPLHMVVPLSDDEWLAVAPTLVLPPYQARKWMRGQLALDLKDHRTYYTEVPDSQVEQAFERLAQLAEEQEKEET